MTSTVKNTLQEACVQILSPRRRIDILRDAMEARSQKRPYTITFCGVNGVGKSTNLAKVSVFVCSHKYIYIKLFFMASYLLNFNVHFQLLQHSNQSMRLRLGGIATYLSVKLSKKTLISPVVTESVMEELGFVYRLKLSTYLLFICMLFLQRCYQHSVQNQITAVLIILSQFICNDTHNFLIKYYLLFLAWRQSLQAFRLTFRTNVCR